MRVTIYKTKLTNDGEAILEKQSSTNYPEMKGPIGSPNDVYQIARNILKIHEETEEYAYTLCLNIKNKLISVFEVSHGNVSSSVIGVREILQKALLSNAVGIIMIHNHPSGDPGPSKEDIDITVRLKEASKIIGLSFLDHIIIGKQGYCSLKEKNIV